MNLLAEGQEIRGTYQVERFLGEGAFAEVYRVRHRFLGRMAMKVFKTAEMTMEDIERKLEEARVLSQLGHPNVIRVFDANTTETARGTCGFFTMEYVAGGTLDHFWRSHGRQFVPVDTTVEIVRQACRGLMVAHSEKPPIIHRDIKPGNVLIGYDGSGLRVRVSDFGLAKRANPLSLLVSSRGTLSFKSPEALRDGTSDSCAGDVWALGCTLYLLFTDRMPYEDDALLRAGDRLDPPAPPSRFNIQVDEVLDRIVTRALAFRVEDRHASARQLLADLEGWTPGSEAKRDPATTPTSKDVLGGDATPIGEDRARRMASDAMALARSVGSLREAADLLEEALNHWPPLRPRFESRLKLWRQGVIN